MKMIRLTDATYRAVAEATEPPFRSTGVHQPDGTWLVPISDEAWNGIRTLQLPGESEDDTMMRLLRNALGRKPS